MSHHLAGGVDWNNKKRFNNRFWNVTTLRVVWIEISVTPRPSLSPWSPPCGWCGLKLSRFESARRRKRHHLAGGVDWNIPDRIVPVQLMPVTTLRVVWIEMQSRHCVCNNRWVTTLRVVWIEMQLIQFPPLSGLSPPCGWCGLKSQSVTVIKTETGHHLAGGVDWNFRAVPLYAGTGSPPCGWCGLKSDRGPFWFIREMVTTLRVVWIQIITQCPLLAMS